MASPAQTPPRFSLFPTHPNRYLTFSQRNTLMAWEKVGMEGLKGGQIECSFESDTIIFVKGRSTMCREKKIRMALRSGQVDSRVVGAMGNSREGPQER